VIARYTLPEMAEVWSEKRKIDTWLAVELAIVDALAAEGRVPAGAAKRIRERARYDSRRMRELEEVTKHDVLSFVETVGESLGEDSTYFHMGVTSSDVLDTALALVIKDATQLVVVELTKVRQEAGRLAGLHRETLTIGRTHGMHAEPMSLALKFAVWYNDLGRAVARIERARDGVCVGKISGAVGNYSHFPPEIEERALGSLGIGYERPATQVVQRDRHADYLCSLALSACVMEKVAVELRHLQRTEVGEAEEPFTEGQKGSSSMPHKRNPITLERVTGLSRLVRANALAAMENVALWHERDISHSSVERVILPDSTIAVHYMAGCLAEILGGLKINSERMLKNTGITGGMVYSQRLMLCLLEAGWERRPAYERVQQIAQDAHAEGRSLKEQASMDGEVVEALGDDGLNAVFDPTYYTKHTDRILRDIGIRGC
jgi:adenylosuccinate lyase